MRKVVALMTGFMLIGACTAIHTKANTSVTNETAASSMYGLNGQFEHYYSPNYPSAKTSNFDKQDKHKRFIIKYKRLKAKFVCKKIPQR